MSCDPFRQNHKRFVANTLLDQFSDISEENLFLSIGKITQWGITAGSDIPVSSMDTVQDDTDFWRGLIAAKRINRSDISLVIRRIDWTASTVYRPYRNNVDLFDDTIPADFYALVDEERVYVCIDNNYDSPSLYPPTHTDTTIRRLGDGYRWKFLYSIPESKRKFLTKSRPGAIGYMPVEYVETLRPSDDRTLQWNVQQAAVNGKIEFAYINEEAKGYWRSTPSCVLPSNSNVVVRGASAGGMTAYIYSQELLPDSNLYKGMVLSIDAGPGQGQRRVIKNFTYGVSGSYGIAQVEIDALVLGLSGTDDGDQQSYFSILPQVVVDGDGRAYNNTNNPAITTADFVLKFAPLPSATGASGATASGKILSSIEVVDGGQEYTYANLSVPKGLAYVEGTPSQYIDLSKNIFAVMPPQGGHGANPVRELGAAAYMIVKEYSQDEGGKVNTDNDFRQFGILRNPLLRDKQVRLKFYQPGLTGSFVVGTTAGYRNGPVGTVLEWCPGQAGTTATSQLVLGDVHGGTGTFSAGATVGSLTVFDVVNKTVAGTEGRHLMKLTLIPTSSEFSSNGNDFRFMNFVHGVGDRASNTPQSRSSGEVYSWKPTAGSNKSGDLYLENPKGKFNVGEQVLQTTPFFAGSNGLTGSGKIYSIDTALVNVPSTYDLTTSVTLFGENFVNGTFEKDTKVTFVRGMTSSSGYVVDWTPATGGTNGYMRLTGVQGTVVAGMTAQYFASNGPGLTSLVSALVQSIEHNNELKYRSGDVLYIQNIKPIMRDIEQREEIKLVIEF
jgi:hypothetical protein